MISMKPSNFFMARVNTGIIRNDLHTYTEALHVLELYLIDSHCVSIALELGEQASDVDQEVSSECQVFMAQFLGRDVKYAGDKLQGLVHCFLSGFTSEELCCLGTS